MYESVTYKSDHFCEPKESLVIFISDSTLLLTTESKTFIKNSTLCFRLQEVSTDDDAWNNIANVGRAPLSKAQFQINSTLVSNSGGHSSVDLCRAHLEPTNYIGCGRFSMISSFPALCHTSLRNVWYSEDKNKRAPRADIWPTVDAGKSLPHNPFSFSATQSALHRHSTKISFPARFSLLGRQLKEIRVFLERLSL